MKTKVMFKKSILAGAVLTLLSGCNSDLDTAGIQPTGDVIPTEAVFDVGSAGFNRSSRVIEESNEAGVPDTVKRFYFKTQVNADFTTEVKTQPIIGISNDSKATARLVSIKDITGTIIDPDVITAIETAELEGNELDFDIVETPIELTDSQYFNIDLYQTTPVNSLEPIGSSELNNGAQASFSLGTEVEFDFVLNDSDLFWGKKIQFIVEIGGVENEFLLQVNERDAEITAPSSVEFLGIDKFNAKPGRAFETPPISFNDFNTRAPINFTKMVSNDLDSEAQNLPEFELEYSLGSGFKLYEGEDVFIRSGENLVLRITPPENVFSHTYSVGIEVGEEVINAQGQTSNVFSDTVSVSSYAEDYVPGPDINISFPPANSATIAENITLRGTTNVSADQYEFDESQDINVEKIKIYKVAFLGDTDLSELITEVDVNLIESKTTSLTTGSGERKLNFYDWQTSVELEDGVTYIALVTESDLTNDGNVGISEPTYIQVAKEPSIEFFPDSASSTLLKNLTDITVDNRTASPILYMTDNNQNNATLSNKHAIVWRYPLAASAKPTCAVLPETFTPGRANGVQFNHAQSELGGIYLSTQAGSMFYYPDTMLSGVTSSVSKGLGSTGGNGPQLPSKSAFTADGLSLYVSTQSRGNFMPDQQQIIGLVSPKFTTADNGDISVSGLQTGPRKGVVAKETTAAEDAVNTLNNGVALDIYTIYSDTNEVQEEWVLSLDGNPNGVQGVNENRNNTESTVLRKMLVLDNPSDYEPETSTQLIQLVDENDVEIELRQAHSIAIDDVRHNAFIADTENDIIWKVDLTKISSDTKLVATKFADNETLPNAEQFEFDRISSIIYEGGLDYLIATDNNQSAIYAIDVITGERVYLLKALGETTAAGNVCDL